MFKLLNRLSWIIALALGLSIMVFLGMLNPYGFDDLFFLFLIIGVGLAWIIKSIFFSNNFIRDRLEYFYEKVKEDLREELPSSIKEVSEKPFSTSTLSMSEEEEPEKIKESEMIANATTNMREEETKKEEVEYSPNYNYEEQKENIETSKEPNKVLIYIKKFLSENILAKIGGLLVFLAMIFFLNLIYANIGPVGRIITGFIVGFIVFGAGVWLDNKKLTSESRVLLGLGILINYLVILSGRHLLGEGTESFLSVGITLFFLILNTVFGVLVSFYYKSTVLFIFSFLFAYLNPFLVGETNIESPYTMILYSLVVSIAGLVIANSKYLIDSKLSKYLIYISFFGGNILFLFAPFSTEIGWTTKLVSTALLSLISIFQIYRLGEKKFIFPLFLGVYILLVLLIGSADMVISNISSNFSIFISYILFIMIFFIVGIYAFLLTSIRLLLSLLLAPIIILLLLISGGVLSEIIFILAGSILAYIIAFSFIFIHLSSALKYIYFIVLGVFIFFINILLVSSGIFDGTSLIFDSLQYGIVILVSLIFLGATYYLSTKKSLEYLYVIGTIGTIVILAPILVVNKVCLNDVCQFTDTHMNFSLLAIVIFAFANILFPFVNNNIIKKEDNIKNLVSGIVLGALFIIWQLFRYGELYFSGITLGLSIMALAGVYFFLSIGMMNKLSKELKSSEEKTSLASKNTILSYLGITISLFSLAIAFVFSEHDEIISAIWLFEASLLYYFYHITKEIKIYIGGLILSIIGVTDLALLIDVVEKNDFIFLIPFTLIFGSFIANLKFLERIKPNGTRIAHDLVHILGIIILSMLLLQIIPSTGNGWSMLGISSFVLALSFVYAYFYSGIISKVFVFAFIGFLLIHIPETESIFRRLDYRELEYMRILQYLVTIILGVGVFIFKKFYDKKSKLPNILESFYYLYLFIISTLYIYDIINSTFTITIYRSAIAFIFLNIGINKDKINFRTIGLYILILTLIKVVGYDIFYGINDTIFRVIALLIVGIIMIVVSSMYSKKYKNNLAGEFSISNLMKKANINDIIKNIDISGIKEVIFRPNNSKSFEIRTENIKKIAKYVIDKTEKTSFEPRELDTIYLEISSGYKSNLGEDSYKKAKEILKEFVQKGGTIEIK